MGHSILRLAGLAVLAVLASNPAAAHTFGAGGAGFGHGFLHPLSGLDHLLAMLAVGFWASQLHRKAMWLTPAAFVGALMLGAGLGWSGLSWPAVETGIIGSIIVIGLLTACAARLPTAFGLTLIGLFGLFHGHAHGAEIPEAVAPVLYGLGFVLATVLLHATGMALGLTAAAIRWPALTRAAGAGVAAVGLWLLVGV